MSTMTIDEHSLPERNTAHRWKKRTEPNRHAGNSKQLRYFRTSKETRM
ncbi:hypothetical protein ANCCAN_16333 [Ancylostoma caninum]|uniref:Uncharacterized protein n=1 Tax=Ancylostoma caninum TaxID=29170 RepID=A0A368G407_ANCCA|nr:hypothetical protein ANCCAN_16333 [Ancylostoma caninum]